MPPGASPREAPGGTGQRIYVIACWIGAALPLSQFLPWLAEHGPALPLLLRSAFVTPIAAFAWLVVLGCAAVLIVFMFAENRRLEMPAPWLPLRGLCLAWVALPLFLLLRQRQLACQA